jgi:hypothetical protein
MESGLAEDLHSTLLESHLYSPLSYLRAFYHLLPSSWDWLYWFVTVLAVLQVVKERVQLLVARQQAVPEEVACWFVAGDCSLAHPDRPLAVPGFASWPEEGLLAASRHFALLGFVAWLPSEPGLSAR